MNVVAALRRYGVEPVWRGGKLGIVGLASLDAARAEMVKQLAAAHRQALLDELRPDPAPPSRATLGPIRQGGTHPSCEAWPDRPSSPCPDCGTLDAWEPTCAPRGWVCACKTMHACPGAREAARLLWRCDHEQPCSDA
ncbi:hypothetical protein [Megalodesulfovibrio gigas]|uniref:Uncharacterized protein n=1 Tax=Megalodesulfovibrio gigas (strain ATCC 19364 / DSM 1382 / NCIMB 9332 / VKM B-1759) TaxID=1121448 RepID=T2GFD0_MEGG1|nr:hypothetical protein [Megalodesulfovibrio gigas]AGW14998.1 hypothetical protein DGI_3302 [Megalodesulfovibrio gigas DSM 1382 = ATCC 19364]